MYSVAPSEDLLLVPSSIQVPNELYLDVGSVPTGMIPLKGKPMIEHIAEAYDDFDLTRVVTVGESANSIREHVKRSNYEWTVIDTSGSSSLGETVYTALDAFNANNGANRSLYINFADTLISPLPPNNDRDVVSYQIRDRTYRWTSFEIESKRIVNPKPKNEHVRGDPQPCFAGHFSIAEPNGFYQKLRETPRRIGSKLDYFYRGLLSYLESSEYELYEPELWLDVGHLDTYHQAKKKFLNTREFNKLENHGKNTIIKRSDDSTTLINEITWYNAIPTELQPYLPRIYDYSTETKDPYLKMEYIGYSSLSDLQLYGSHGQHIWEDIFQRLFNMHREFQSFTADASATSIQQALEAIYLDKTHRRLNQLHENDRFQVFFSESSIEINGESYPSLSLIQDRIGNVLTDSGLLTRESLSIVHGDLCLPNILYDPRNEILKLIDPRGEFGEFDIHGDPRYDLAKLRHSFVGHYEHLINERFEVNSELDAPKIGYNIYTKDEQIQREKRFDLILDEETGADLEIIKLIEALLFLSMVPLHNDDYKRQLCMLAKGIEKFTPFMDWS